MAAGDGGAIAIESIDSSAVIYLVDNIMSDNKANRGGAIASARASLNATLIIDQTTITGNTASLQGGAIWISNAGPLGKVSLLQSTIAENSAGQQGGAVFFSTLRDLEIVDTAITGNKSLSASPSISRGGGVYVFNGDLTIIGSTISGNAAASGGGLYSRMNELSITASTFENNQATAGTGGGILSQSDRLTLVGSTLSGNSAGGLSPQLSAGGGLWHSPATSAPDTISDNVFANNSATGYGGGLYLRSGLEGQSPNPVTLNNLTITGNSSARSGGGLAFGIGNPGALMGTLILNGGTISGNTSNLNGGGIYSRAANLTIYHTTISGNNARLHGGGLAVPQSGPTLQVTVFGATFHQNAAGFQPEGHVGDGNGGAMSILSAFANVSLFDTAITENTARNGAGIYRQPQNSVGLMSLTNSLVSGNIATISGGGIFSRIADVSLLNSSIIGNSATTGRGGALYLGQNGDLSVTGSTIAGNFARQDGGGVWMQAAGLDRATIHSSTISGNSSIQGTGGLSLRVPTTIRFSTITKNSGAGGTSAAGGLFVGSDGGPIELDHTIIANNTQNDSVNPDLRLSSAVVNVRFSLIGDNRGTTLAEAPLARPTSMAT